MCTKRVTDVQSGQLKQLRLILTAARPVEVHSAPVPLDGQFARGVLKHRRCKGIRTRKLLGAKGIATRNKGLTTSNNVC